MISLIRIQRQKSEFQTASQSEIALKMANRSKYGDFYRIFTRQSSLDRHPYRVVYDEVEIEIDLLAISD